MSNQEENMVNDDNNDNVLDQEVVEPLEEDVLMLKDNLRKFGSEILRLQSEVKEKDEIIIREKAENQNLRSRHIRELEDKGKYAISEFSKDLIDVMESLYRALEFQKNFDMTDSKIASMFDGIDMTLKILDKSFTKYGIRRVYPLNQEFNHQYHQAISKISLQDQPNNQVIEVIQAGYTLNDRLLKPALVIVNVNEE